jgi:multicomponent Na+:H+ antiporter subunit E
MNVVNSGIKNFLYLFVILALIWLCLCSSLDTGELLAGLTVCLVLAGILCKSYRTLDFPDFNFKRLIYLFFYIGVLFVEIAKANIDVAWRIIHPRMPIHPGIVIIKTELKGNIAKMALANSITLTPGTFTMDILGDQLLIHWIDVKTTDAVKAQAMIGERFEKYLKHIFN